ncbi:MAG: biliverdin-producing heme oxygenase [Methylomicrobium sp.]|nr:biliverdin-producing heme oxygenase [Methylomicrobium sp.]
MHTPILPSLSEVLKKSTSCEHRKTENIPIMQDVFGNHFSLKNYQTLLKRMLSLYLPMERKMSAFLINPSLSYSYLPKSPLLQADLQNISNHPIHLTLTESDTPNLRSHEDFLGILYVLEGSTLGGSVIIKRLEQHIDVQKAATFFFPYRDNTQKKWAETRSFIDDCGHTLDLNHDFVCNAAIATFQSFRGALSDETII